MERVALYKALQFKYFELDDDDKTLYENLKIELCEIVKSLNKNYIGVQNNLQYVERYSELSAWEDFKQAKFVEIKKKSYCTKCYRSNRFRKCKKI